MKVLVQEDPSIPNVALYTFFRVGSRNEHEGITGLSHFFEHMMFNGAKKYGPGQFDRAMEGAGGNNNAYTTNDMTVYQDWFPKSQLELIFDLEADRVQYLAFDPKIVESERQVVYSERRLSVDNNNFGLLDEQLEATAIMAHPYHWSVIGWPSDIEKWTLDDLKAYFAKGYSPSNATMVVVGDVKADNVFRLAEKYMEPIPAHDPPAAHDRHLFSQPGLCHGADRQGSRNSENRREVCAQPGDEEDQRSRILAGESTGRTPGYNVMTLSAARSMDISTGVRQTYSPSA
jgi:zinc protease